MLISSTLADIITTEIRHLLGDALDDDDILSGSETFQQIGLNSLMLARLIISLEDELGIDPFAHSVSIVDVHTVSDLWAAYEESLSREAEANA